MHNTLARCLGVAALILPPAAAAGQCSVSSGLVRATLVELYTSEGCSSCPPADRWLSQFKGRPDVVALAFHVDYWDRLGWKDRFSSPDYTLRQMQQQRSNGARFSYTPQVLVDGIDRPGWRSQPVGRGSAAAPVRVSLVREGAVYIAKIEPLAAAPARLEAFWALTENGHRSRVDAGENGGATLAHDFVVREYRPVQAWPAAPGRTTTLRFEPGTTASAEHPRQLNLVLHDADSGRPLQAVALDC